MPADEARAAAVRKFGTSPESRRASAKSGCRAGSIAPAGRARCLQASPPQPGVRPHDCRDACARHRPDDGRLQRGQCGTAAAVVVSASGARGLVDDAGPARAGGVQQPDFGTWQPGTTSFEHMVAYGISDSTLVESGEASRTRISRPPPVLGSDGRASLLGALPEASERDVLVLSYRTYRTGSGGPERDRPRRDR